jgi:transposase-like protein
MGKRECYSALFKARVAIEAIKEKETLRELSERFNVNIR